MKELELLKEGIITDPSFIEEIDDPVLLDIIDSLLPYSVGMEFECNKKSNYDVEIFKSISDMIEVLVDSGEQRYRIPSGIKGIYCLKELSDNLKEYSTLNDGSGIHYHIDMTECFHLLNKNIIENNKEWVLKELDTWGYKGRYNRRDCDYKESQYSLWCVFQKHFQTAEIRIGEMTFEYDLLMKRILHCSDIIRKLKNIMISGMKGVPLFFKSQEDSQEQIPEINPQQIILNRTIRR